MANSKSKKTKLTRELLLKSPEFWIENIRTELFNMVQDYMDDNKLNRKKLAETLGVSKGYISQVLNGDSDHRLSKLVTLATALGKAPYIYLKDIDHVLEADANNAGIFIDFEELEQKAEKCDRLEKLNALPISFSSNLPLNIPTSKFSVRINLSHNNELDIPINFFEQQDSKKTDNYEQEFETKFIDAA